MFRLTHRESIIILFDFIISLFAFWVARYFGTLPKWYWLVLSAVIWIIFSHFFGKLKFDQYKRIRYALIGILIVNIITGAFLFSFYRYCIPAYRYDHSILIAVGIITLQEWMLYYAVRQLIYRKIPFFYEAPIIKTASQKAQNEEAAPPIEIKNEDVNHLIDNIKAQSDPIKWIKENKNFFSEKTVVLETSNPEVIFKYKTSDVDFIINTLPLNKIRHINTGFAYTNYCLHNGGFIACHCTTSEIHKEQIMRQSPIGINYIIFFFDYLWHRVLSKLALTKKFYFAITKSKCRVLTRVEVLGRLYRAGFEVIAENTVNEKYYIIAAKVKEPIRDDKPSNGMLIRLKRIGKNGKVIGVYKFRTMHAYSEYLQPYIFQHNHLNKGGKIANDYRVSRIGKFMRKTWIDELPMLLNWIKGDLKLVGVRPLSSHYFSLYTPELQQLRIKTKPGLVPPFYADMPVTLDEIQDSEQRYLTAYLKSPHLTDWRYFWKAAYNIVFKGKRSK